MKKVVPLSMPQSGILSRCRLSRLAGVVGVSWCRVVCPAGVVGVVLRILILTKKARRMARLFIGFDF